MLAQPQFYCRVTPLFSRQLGIIHRDFCTKGEGNLSQLRRYYIIQHCTVFDPKDFLEHPPGSPGVFVNCRCQNKLQQWENATRLACLLGKLKFYWLRVSSWGAGGYDTLNSQLVKVWVISDWNSWVCAVQGWVVGTLQYNNALVLNARTKTSVTYTQSSVTSPTGECIDGLSAPMLENIAYFIYIFYKQ